MEKTPRSFILDNLLAMSAYWVSSGAIISSLTKYFGFSLSVSNLITGFTATLPIFQLIGGLVYGQSKNPLRFLRISNGLWRVFLPLVFFSVLLPHWAGAPLMLVSYLLAVAIFQFACPSQISWMSSCVDKQVSSNYYSVREMVFMAGFTVTFCISSMTIDKTQRSQNPQLGFLLIGILISVLLSLSLVVLLRIPAPPVAPQKSPSLKALLDPLRSRPFRCVMLSNACWSFACMFVGGFAAVYQVRILEVTFFQIMLWSTVGNIARTLATPLMGQLARHIGWKYVSALCAGIMSVCALLWIQTTTDNYSLFFPILMILGGLPFAGIGVGFLKMQISTSPEETRSIYFAVLALFNSLASILGSLLCSSLIEALELFSPALLRYVFGVGLVFVLIAILLILHIPYQKEAA